jgi:hypothetical protein
LPCFRPPELSVRQVKESNCDSPLRVDSRVIYLSGNEYLISNIKGRSLKMGKKEKHGLEIIKEMFDKVRNSEGFKKYKEEKSKEETPEEENMEIVLRVVKTEKIRFNESPPNEDK